MKKILTTVFLIGTLLASAQSLRELYQEGTKAYEEKNYQLFKEKMYTIDTLRPNYPPVVYNLAGAYALTGEKEKAIQKLRQYAMMNATLDFSADSDFASLLGTNDFEQVKRLQKQLTKDIPVEVVYEFPILTSHPETIAYCKKQNAFYFGNVRDGKIWKAEVGKDPQIWAESPENSWAVMGAEVTADQKTLWACTSGMENYENLAEADKGKVSVLKYNIKKGTLLETFTLPANHVFGDLIVDNTGNVYISDGTGNQLYWISKKTGELEVFADLSETIINMQGLTFNQDQSAIYLSDYIDGIYKLDLVTKEVSKLATSQDVLLKGIDGLYFSNNRLIGLHNGMTPNRVISYQISGDGLQILSKEVLVQGDQLGEPTQGVFVDKSLHFIVNSPWASYDREGNFNVTENNIKVGKID